MKDKEKRPEQAWVPDCLPCEIVAGKRVEPGGVLYEDAYWHVGHAMGPVVWPGFLIVKLKRHCEQIAALTADEAAALGPLVRGASRAVTAVLNPAKVYVCSFGDGIEHIHVWILPRPPEMQPGMHHVMRHLDVRIALTRLGIKRWVLPEDEVQAMAAALRQQFRQLRGHEGTHPLK